MPQIEGERKLAVSLGWREIYWAGCVADFEEAREAAAFRFEGVDGERFVVAAARMGDVIGATAQGTVVPPVHDVEQERRVGGDGRVQALGWCPGAEADTSDVFATGAGGMERQGTAVARDEVARVDPAADFHLESFEGEIH